ncbi:MAG: OstA family protein [Verrucomicrobia bacterium]|nr:OstA family protein [Verrucomicrobiota bacterium]
MKFRVPFFALALVASLAARAEETAQRTTLDCNNAEMWSVGSETHGICTGSVVLLGTNLKLQCDRLEFVAIGVGDKTATVPTLEKFKYLIATGHVLIVQNDREATCGRAEVLPHDDKVILTENPVLIDHGTDWKTDGEKITMLRGERRVIVEKSHVSGPALRDLGFDKSKASTPADGATKPSPGK